jgi:crotonobetainyl-CoA:carnitine CoA-transferase CaiB-like acyl-CoA transferase
MSAERTPVTLKSDDRSQGPLHGLLVVELAHDLTCFAGKLLGQLGADVIVIEPPGGHISRTYGPFANDTPDPNRCLWWWWYNTNKRSVVLDLSDDLGQDQFRRLTAQADIVIEGEPRGALSAIQVDYESCSRANPQIIWASISPFGSASKRSGEPATDLTLLAGGGTVWSCGYDDHRLPPIRGAGNQSLHTVGIHAALAVLTACVYRDRENLGQHIDVSAHAAINVTTEAATIEWLVGRKTVQRQTGRHAMTQPTLPTQVLAADGKYVQTGFIPPRPDAISRLLEWLDELSIRDEFTDAVVLELGLEREIHHSEIGEDPLATEIFRAEREVLQFLASKMSAYDFFIGAQERGLACGIIYSPEEVLNDRHFAFRGFPVAIFHPELGRDVIYPGAPLDFIRTPMTVSRAPRIGEHTTEILSALKPG